MAGESQPCESSVFEVSDNNVVLELKGHSWRMTMNCRNWDAPGGQVPSPFLFRHPFAVFIPSELSQL